MTGTSNRWATVTAISPALRVKLDGDAAALVMTPDSLVDVAALAVNDRVRVSLAAGRLLIIGRAGGVPLTARVSSLESRATVLEGEAWNRVAPTSISVSTGSASAGSNNLITVTAADQVKLNGLFRAGHRYKLLIAATSASAEYLYTTLTAAGTLLGAAGWGGNVAFQQTGTLGNLYASSTSSTPVMGYISASDGTSDFEIDVIRPFAARPIINTKSSYAGSSHTHVWGSYINGATPLNADGIYLIHNAAWSGTVEVFEYGLA